MDRVIKINYWIGIVVAIALLLQSAYGIYNFVHTKQQAQSIQKNFSQNMPNFKSGNESQNPSNGSNSAPQFGGGTQNSGQRFGAMRSRSDNAQTNPIELVIHIVSLILAVGALVVTAIIARNNARKKKELASTEDKSDNQ